MNGEIASYTVVTCNDDREGGSPEHETVVVTLSQDASSITNMETDVAIEHVVASEGSSQLPNSLDDGGGVGQQISIVTQADTGSPPMPGGHLSVVMPNVVDPGSIGQNVMILDDGEIAPCAICGDRGSGYHYSVYSCEGCKGFFKRTVQKNLSYACKENQECFINKFTRNNCQYCRFQKCQLVGMKKEAVREDRTPGGKHRHKRLRMEDSASPTPTSVSTQSTYPAEEYDDVLVTKLTEAQPYVVPSPEDIMSTAPSEQLDINRLMQYGYMELRMIIEWARKVPGFSDLLIEDQMALLKASFMELNVLRLAFRSQDTTGSVLFAEGILMSQDQSMDIGWGHDLITYTLEFIEKLREISVDTTEFCILNAIVLSYPDAAGVQSKLSVIELQNKMLDCLRKYSCRAYPADPRRYARILLRLPSLRMISAKAAERFLSMSLDGSIKMNSLVLEMMS